MTSSAETDSLDPREIIRFCACCFASSDNSSWGEAIHPDYCMNCSGGYPVQLPRGAVEQIRRSASWVGKRYYPHSEDKENFEERKRLRALVKSWPGRAASEQKKGYWMVNQKTPEGSISVFVEAISEEDAIAKAALRLPYYDEEILGTR